MSASKMSRVRCEATKPEAPAVSASDAEPVAPAMDAPEAMPAAPTMSAELDPLDGSIQYGSPLGNTDIVSNAMSIFAGGNASEVINGRAAMIGFFSALPV